MWCLLPVTACTHIYSHSERSVALNERNVYTSVLPARSCSFILWNSFVEVSH